MTKACTVAVEPALFCTYVWCQTIHICIFVGGKIVIWQDFSNLWRLSESVLKVVFLSDRNEIKSDERIWAPGLLTHFPQGLKCSELRFCSVWVVTSGCLSYCSLPIRCLSYCLSHEQGFCNISACGTDAHWKCIAPFCVNNISWVSAILKAAHLAWTQWPRAQSLFILMLNLNWYSRHCCCCCCRTIGWLDNEYDDNECSKIYIYIFYYLKRCFF